MAELRNLTPFANFQFPSWDAEGNEFGTLMVKTAWDILPDGSCRLSDEQEPFAFTDLYHGDMHHSALRYASDLVPYKPRMDVVLNATAFAPGGAPSARWEAGVDMRVVGEDAPCLSQRLAITGPRQWQRQRLRWVLDDPAPISRLDIRWDHAYGGTIETDRDDFSQPILTAFEQNPLGQGFARADVQPRRRRPIPAPQILGPEEELKDPFAEAAPVGLGPIPAAWLPRRPLGGTYDAHWEETRWPGWPEDYDFAFHNAAPRAMQVPLMVGPELEFRLTNLHPDKPEWVITLPDARLSAYCAVDGQGSFAAMALDTVFLDIAEDRLGDPRIFTVSRLVFDWQAVDWIVLSRRGKAAPRPDPARQPPIPKPADVGRYAPPDEWGDAASKPSPQEVPA